MICENWAAKFDQQNTSEPLVITSSLHYITLFVHIYIIGTPLNEYKQKELKKNIVETTLPIPIFIWEIGDILCYNVGSYEEYGIF